MKTKIDNDTLQAAIDEACLETSISPSRPSGDALVLNQGSWQPEWNAEAPARLALARAFLARLPEITLLDGHAEEYECVMKHLDDLGVATKDKDKTLSLVGRISKAVQGAMDVALLPETQPPVVDGNKPDPYAELKAAYAEGKKIQTQSREDSKWSDWSFPVEPLWNTPPNRYRIKPEPKPTQLWAVGDKVKLKGGSFTMTVEQADSDGIACEWHDSNGVPQFRTYTPETLQPA